MADGRIATNKNDFAPAVDIVEELVPVKYNVQSELMLKVDAGSQDKNFDLKSGK